MTLDGSKSYKTSLKVIKTKVLPGHSGRIDSRCMSLSVDLPGCGRFVVSLTPSSTAGDILLGLRERLPDQSWHGNKVLSYGHSQLQREDVVEAAHSPLVLSNYSEIANKERSLVSLGQLLLH